jgi:mono/diheme cytochrome c family protein
MRKNNLVTLHRTYLCGVVSSVFVATLALLPISAFAQAPAQAPEAGRALAERWCASCHIIDRAPAAATASGLPSFPAIAAKATTTKQSLDLFLSSEHTRMPDFSLGRYERNALADYILSLR